MKTSSSQKPARALLGTVLFGAGLVVTAALALAMSVFLAFFYQEWNPGGTSGYVGLPSVFLIIEPLIVLAAWIAVWAWLQKRWLIAGLCLLATTFGPWGINITLAVVPITLGPLLLIVALIQRLARPSGSVAKKRLVANDRGR
jgi:hypothetical protein